MVNQISVQLLLHKQQKHKQDAANAASLYLKAAFSNPQLNLFSKKIYLSFISVCLKALFSVLKLNSTC